MTMHKAPRLWSRCLMVKFGATAGSEVIHTHHLISEILQDRNWDPGELPNFNQGAGIY